MGRWILLGASGCGAVTPCVEERLELWCYHDEAAHGLVLPEGVPASDLACETPSSEGAIAVGAYEVADTAPGFSGVDHWFLEGEHVATRYWTDVNHYCGDFEFWYGRKPR